MSVFRTPPRCWKITGLSSLLLANPVLAAEVDPGTVDVSQQIVPASAEAAGAAASSTDLAQAVPTIPVASESPQTPATASPKSASRLIEEVVVTAQKREENIQDVPIAITAFSADKLEALGIESAQDLERVTPGLTITNAVGFNVAYLRGVGTDAFLPGADPSVPFYLDGVALLGAQGSSDTLGRVQRVEVLKGPQGTLFGRNATGGAINIVTPDPNSQFSGDVNIEHGNYNAWKGLIYANLPITEGLAVSASGFNSQQDNFYTNDTGPIIDVYARGGRLKLRWEALDDLAITLAASYQKASNNAGIVFENTRVAPVLCPAGVCLLPQDPKADRHVSLDSVSGAVINANLYSGIVDWKLPVVDLKLIGSAQRLNAPFVQADFDKSNLPLVNIRSIKQLSKQTTGELQILSNANTPFADHFKWVGGAFYLHSIGGYDPIAFVVAPGAVSTLSAALGPQAGSLGGLLGNTLNTLLLNAGLQPLASGVTLYNYGMLESTSISGYFQGTYSITDTVDLTVGARYQDEKRHLLHSHTSAPDGSGGEVTLLSNYDLPELHSQQTSPRIALQWRPFGEGTQFYSSWARGFKSPTYNTVNLLGGLPATIGGISGGTGDLHADIKPVKAEKVDSYELGVKTELFDRALRLDAAAFYTKQKDLLTGFVAVTSGGVVAYDNAPGARIYGAEADALWTPLPTLDPGFVVTAAVTGLDAKYTDYPNGKGFDTTTGLAFGNGGTELLPARDFKGNRIVRTPRLSWNLGLSQTIPLASGSLELGADTNFTSGFYFLPQNASLYSRQPYNLVNARVTYLYDPWQMQLSAFCNNVTDKDYNEVVFVDDFGRNQVLNAPRTYGVRAKWSF